MVPACGGDLEREPGGGLPANVGQIGTRRRVGQLDGLGRVGPGRPAAERAHHVAEAIDRPDGMPADELGLDRAPGRHDDLGLG